MVGPFQSNSSSALNAVAPLALRKRSPGRMSAQWNNNSVIKRLSWAIHIFLWKEEEKRIYNKARLSLPIPKSLWKIRALKYYSPDSSCSPWCWLPVFKIISLNILMIVGNTYLYYNIHLLSAAIIWTIQIPPGHLGKVLLSVPKVRTN